uniref:NADH-ubiquinone oxidoreductase chain 4L n=1 Tax=Zaptyx stimpsoni TaxID=1885718 RepID=A0A224AB18_9EUPU|nr:NADH dehydrogenase subunit 4L [Zaptyx stimpsoni]
MIKFCYFLMFLLLALHLFLFITHYHLLSALMVLEGMVLILLVFLAVMSYRVDEGLSMYLFVLTLSVCEASMGLTLLISLVKINSNDLIMNQYL